MKVSVIAPFHAVLPQKPQHFLTAVAGIEGRIMQKAKLLPLPLPSVRSPAARPPGYAFSPCGCRLLQLVKPTPCAAQGHIAVKSAVVVENLQESSPCSSKKTLHFRRRVPPVVVVPFMRIFFFPAGRGETPGPAGTPSELMPQERSPHRTVTSSLPSSKKPSRIRST